MGPLAALLLSSYVALPQYPNSSPGPTKVLPAKMLPGLETTARFAGYKDGKTPQDVIRYFQFSFENKTDYELASVTVRVRIDQADGSTYVTKPVTYRKFGNLTLRRLGSGLPHESIAIADIASFEHLSHLWNSDSQTYGELVSAEVYLPGQNLSDNNHLLAWLRTSPDSVTIPRLRKEPSVLKSPPTHPAGRVCWTAFAFSSVPVLKTMMALGPKPYLVEPKQKVSLFHLAAVNSHTGALDLALSLGAPIDTQNSGRQTPLGVAMSRNNQPAFDWLLAHGVKPKNHADGGLEEIQLAVHQGSIYFVKRLVATGVDPKMHHSKGMGLMQMAAFANARPAMFELLMTYGLSVDDVEPKAKVTPLMAAASVHANDAAIWLVRHGARLDAEDGEGRAVWDYAKMSNTLQTDRFFRQALRKAGIKVPDGHPERTW